MPVALMLDDDDAADADEIPNVVLLDLLR